VTARIPLAVQGAAGLLFMLACLVAAPFFLSDFQRTLFATGVAYSVAVLGVALGFASVGMLALTQPAMMLIGAYGALYLTTRWEWSFIPAAATATLFGMAIAVPLGWLTCRLDRFSYAVLGFAFTYLVCMLTSSGLLVKVTGGELGKPVPAGTLFGIALEGIAGYVFIAAAAMAAFALAWVMFRSTMGRMLLVMREDDVVAGSVGVNTSAFKIGITAIVSGFGTLSGILAAQATNYVAPPHFDVGLSILLLAMALVGGSRYLAGAFVGTMMLGVVPAMIDLKQVDRELIGGVLLVVCLALYPEGVLRAFGDLFRRVGVRRWS
jgi:branched-chain amino acid transport system permease protein